MFMLCWNFIGEYSFSIIIEIITDVAPGQCDKMSLKNRAKTYLLTIRLSKVFFCVKLFTQPNS